MIKFNSLSFNSIQFMVIKVPSEQPDGQLYKRYVVQNIHYEGK